MARSLIPELLPALSEAFSNHEYRVFSARQIEAIRAFHEDSWNLAPSTTGARFLRQLLQHSPMSQLAFDINGKHRSVFIWEEPSNLEIIAGIWSKAYISHGAAAFLHGLTKHYPEYIVVNEEQRQASPQGSPLTQDRIDAAFSKPPRLPTRVTQIREQKIYFTNGRNTWGIGMTTLIVENKPAYHPFSVTTTDIERTLIDLVVRPAYVGGPEIVQKIFRQAITKLNPQRLAEMLSSLKFVYPYQQAIGFYLEGAGARADTLNYFREKEMEYDFYLAHGMEQSRYVSTWRLHVPLSL